MGDWKRRRGRRGRILPPGENGWWARGPTVCPGRAHAEDHAGRPARTCPVLPGRTHCPAAVTRWGGRGPRRAARTRYAPDRAQDEWNGALRRVRKRAGGEGFCRRSGTKDQTQPFSRKGSARCFPGVSQNCSGACRGRIHKPMYLRICINRACPARQKGVLKERIP